MSHLVALKILGQSEFQKGSKTDQEGKKVCLRKQARSPERATVIRGRLHDDMAGEQ